MFKCGNERSRISDGKHQCIALPARFAQGLLQTLYLGVDILLGF